MDKIFNWEQWRIIAVSALSPVLAFLTPTKGFIFALVTMFAFNVWAGMRADGVSVVRCRNFSFRKFKNARTLSFADDYGRFVNIQGNDYHHLNPAGGFIAACTIYEKIIYPLNNKHCSETSFRITEDTALPPQTIVEPGILVTDDNYFSMCQSAIEAVQDPNSVKSIA